MPHETIAEMSKQVVVQLFAAALFCACSSPERAAVDSGLGSGSDGGTIGMVDDVACQTRTYTELAADGSKQVIDYQFALIDGVDPTSNWTIEQCDYTAVTTNASGTTTKNLPADPKCPTGNTCTVSGAAYPSPSHYCAWGQGGTFYDGKLYVNCATTTTTYDVNGTMTFKQVVSYAAIRVHH